MSASETKLIQSDPTGVKYREELVGKGDGFQQGDLVKIRYQVRSV